MRFCPNTVALLGAGSTISPISNSDCCAALYSDTQLSPRLLLPTSEHFVISVRAHYAANAPLYPSCILQPQSAGEVAHAISILTGADDSSPLCQFAVRSGGHTPWSGAASIQDGVMIDLAMMNSTMYHPQNSTATIEAGAEWGSVYRWLKQYGVAVMGGRAESVGVGGLVTGGGLSFFAAQYGFVCDNVESFEVVLANGTIVAANQSSHPRLFRVLKGGSSNFGIVTKINIATFPQGDLWGGIVSHDISSTPLQIAALVNFTDHVVDDPHASLVSIWQYSSVQGSLSGASGIQYARPVEAPPIFDEVLQIGSANTTRFADIHDLMMETAPPPGQRVLLLTITFQNDARVVQRILDVQEDMIVEAKARAPGRVWDIISFLQPFPVLYGKLGTKKMGNVLGLDKMDKNSLLYLLFLSWDTMTDDNLFHDLGYRLIDKIKSYAQSINAENDFVYLNYAGKSQNPLRSYGHENLQLMSRVAREYDPSGVFQTQVPGGFKVSTA